MASRRVHALARHLAPPRRHAAATVRGRSASSWAWSSLDPVGAEGSPLAVVGTRSSHGISVLGGKAYVLGGETIARTPIDSDFFVRDLEEADAGGSDWQRLHLADGAASPSPRVAHAQAALGDSIWIFGGRQVGERVKEFNIYTRRASVQPPSPPPPPPPALRLRPTPPPGHRYGGGEFQRPLAIRHVHSSLEPGANADDWPQP